MRSTWYIFGIGSLMTLLGWYLIPDKWGYGLLGFGFAHLILGFFFMLQQPPRSKLKMR